MKKSPILLLLLYFFFTLSLYANPDTDRLKFFDCLVRNDRSGWEDILVEMTQNKDSTNEKDLIEALYGYIGWSYRDDAKKEAGKWIPLFKNCLDRNTPGVLTLSEKYGYQAALLGFQILQTKSKAILLGPRCVSSADRSIQNDSSSAIGYIQKGNIEFFIPKVFGGSKKEGIRYYRQAESYLQNDPKNWQYLYLLCVILEYYIQEQSHDEAVEYYNKIRQIAPEMVWLQQFNESLRLSHQLNTTGDPSSITYISNMKKTVLIIGSSLAGIATALRLSKRGYQVTMIEKNGTPGGRLNRISRDGFIFDVGPTFFSMSYEFEELAKDCAIQLPFKYYPVNPLYQVSYGKGGRTYTIHRDICALAKEFSQEEPDFETQMQRYLAKTGKLFHDSLDIVVRQNFSSKLHYLQELSKINKRHLPLLFSSVQQVVNNHFSSDEVRNIISLPAYFLGNTPAKTNGVYSLLSYTEFLHDGYHNVEGGMYQIVQGLMQELKKSGVETIFDTEITGVERVGNKLTALTDQNGKRYVADQFVVNCDSLLFRSRVLQQKKYTEKNLQKYDWSMGMLTIYIGLECKLDHVALHNYYIGHNQQDQIGRQSPDRQIDKPYFYVNVPSLYNPNCAPEGCESLMFVVPVPNLLLKKEWQDQERIVNDVLREFSERIGLDIFPFIRVKEYYTPENWRDLYNLYSGAALGITHSMSQTGAFRPANIDDEYNNLYYTGASTVPGIGLPMAIISSRLTTERVIGEKITAQYD